MLSDIDEVRDTKISNMQMAKNYKTKIINFSTIISNHAIKEIKILFQRNKKLKSER